MVRDGKGEGRATGIKNRMMLMEVAQSKVCVQEKRILLYQNNTNAKNDETRIGQYGEQSMIQEVEEKQ